jgi:hypothetical protein
MGPISSCCAFSMRTVGLENTPNKDELLFCTRTFNYYFGVSMY